MKRFSMLPGIADMRGNITGAQDIRYQGNKKAYETANGKQASINYRPSYIFYKRGKDGLLYYSVRLHQTAVLNGKTRTSMAVTGSIAAIKSALMRNHAADWAQIQKAYDYVKDHGQLPENVTTFNKYVDYNLRDMLLYRRVSWSFNQASISFTIHNPYDLGSADALGIKNSTWVKFASILAFLPNATISKAYVTIDGTPIFGAVNSSNELDTTTIKAMANPNMVASLVNVAIVEGANPQVTYKGQPLYTPEGTAMRPTTVWVDGAKYTTVDPNI